MVQERRHFHYHRLPQLPKDFKGKPAAVMPASFLAIQDVDAVQAIEINHVKSTFIHRMGNIAGDFTEERGLAVRGKHPPATLEMVRYRTSSVWRSAGAPSAPAATANTERRPVINPGKLNQFIVNLQSHTAPDMIADFGQAAGVSTTARFYP